eukprot:gene525-biopygen9899
MPPEPQNAPGIWRLVKITESHPMAPLEGQAPGYLRGALWQFVENQLRVARMGWWWWGLRVTGVPGSFVPVLSAGCAGGRARRIAAYSEYTNGGTFAKAQAGAQAAARFPAAAGRLIGAARRLGRGGRLISLRQFIPVPSCKRSPGGEHGMSPTVTSGGGASAARVLGVGGRVGARHCSSGGSGRLTAPQGGRGVTAPQGGRGAGGGRRSASPASSSRSAPRPPSCSPRAPARDGVARRGTPWRGATRHGTAAHDIAPHDTSRRRTARRALG